MRTVNIVIYFLAGEELSIVKTLEAKNKTTTHQTNVDHDFCRFGGPHRGPVAPKGAVCVFQRIHVCLSGSG